MKHSFLMIFALLIGCLSCKNIPKENEVKITVDCKECIGKNIKVFYYSALRQEEKVLYNAKFDTSGISTIRLSQQDTTRLSLIVKQNDTTNIFTSDLYLEPNTNIDLRYENRALTFKGDLALINSYLSELTEIGVKRDKYRDVWSKIELHPKSKEELEKYFDDVRPFSDEFFNKVNSDRSLSDYHKKLLFKENDGFEIWSRSFFESELLHATQSMEDDLETENYYNQLDSSAKASFANLTIDPYLSIISGTGYSSYVRWNLSQGFLDLVDVYYERLESDSLSLYQHLKNTVVSNKKLDSDNDFIIGLCLTSGRLLDGIAYDDLSSYIQSFEKDFPHSKYLPELQEVMVEYEDTKPGMPLKDFTLNDPKGNQFKLSDYKGKLIYIDVWATWCGPCVEEFPYSKKLGERYRKNDDLVFLYVSKDNRIDEWKSFLKKNPSLRGVHGNQPGSYYDKDIKDDIMDLYKINGIPRYILIGKDGNIINYNAARPSELVTNNYLDSLLVL